MDAYNQYDISPDDMLETTRTTPLNAWVGDSRLPEDNDRPAAPAVEPSGKTYSQDHPRYDSKQEAEEAYESGPDSLMKTPRQSLLLADDDTSVSEIGGQ